MESFLFKNITKGFAKCGIFLFDGNIFSDQGLLILFVPDRPKPDGNFIENYDSSNRIDICSNILIQSASITPEQIRPYPKASERKISQRKQQITKKINRNTSKIRKFHSQERHFHPIKQK